MTPPVPTSYSSSSLGSSAFATRQQPSDPTTHPKLSGINSDVAGGSDLGNSSTLSRNSGSSGSTKANRDRVDFSQLDAFERKLRKLKSPPGTSEVEHHVPDRDPAPTQSSGKESSTVPVQSSGWKRGEWTTIHQSFTTEPAVLEPVSVESTANSSDSHQPRQVHTHGPPANTSPRPALNQYSAAIHQAATRNNSLPASPSPVSPAISTHAGSITSTPSTLPRHSTLPSDSHPIPSATSAFTNPHAPLPPSSFLSNPTTATLTRGMKTIVDKLMLAPLQVAANTTAQVAHLAVPDDPATHHDRKVLGAIQHTYSQISSAVDTYRSAVYSLVEAETGLADVLLASTTSTLVDPRLGQALDEYGRGIHAHALSTIAYARALDSFADQLNTFTSRALADCLETSRQANQVYTELELYRATGIAHLVAVNNQIVGGIQRAGAAAVAPALGLFGAAAAVGIGIGKSASRTNIGALAEEPASEAAAASTVAVNVDSTVAATAADQSNSSGSGHVGPLTTSPSHLSPDSATSSSSTRPRSRSNASTMSASFDLSQNFANDAHASNLRAKHAKLADALAAKTRVLQDKAVTDLAAQLAAVMAFQQGQQQLGAGGTGSGSDAVSPDEAICGTRRSAGASDLGVASGGGRKSSGYY
ncbi:hypothetical protein BCR44DRAFT_23589 [Catenaria anguillulae PL171]|uniref:AH domain-containing protein n=1 Tax=Catenaria anguillulae PL171 TaxID=765915 RepID=A0A1Y2HQU8_9FUNG|nr:hypothetical protein BCR44DRAFT_23589 [Catenaria anguillulae PL171]